MHFRPGPQTAFFANVFQKTGFDTSSGTHGFVGDVADRRSIIVSADAHSRQCLICLFGKVRDLFAALGEDIDRLAATIFAGAPYQARSFQFGDARGPTYSLTPLMFDKCLTTRRIRAAK